MVKVTLSKFIIVWRIPEVRNASLGEAAFFHITHVRNYALIGGAFGQHINVEQAIQIGLFPDLPWDRFQFLGNTSLAGAYNALVSRPACALAHEIADKLTYLELIADNAFMNELTAALFLPHTRVDDFPSVQALKLSR